MDLTLAEVAQRLGARLVGDGAVRIHGVAGIRDAAPGDLTFLANPRYTEHLAATRASAVIVQDASAVTSLPCLVTPRPYLAFVEALRLFDPRVPETVPPGVHPSAVLAGDVQMGAEVAVGPNVVISAGVTIGARTVLMPGTYVGPSVTIGEDCLLYPHVVVRQGTEMGNRVVIHAGAVIGDDGFGFAPDGEEYRKVPQIGRVIVEDDVEIGANTTIDRATMGVTRIGRGSRIDNLVMVAHNVTIGENCILCGQVGISGSTQVGNHVVLAGQVGIAGHLAIGDGAMIGAQSGVSRSVPAGESWFGYPARERRYSHREIAAAHQLPEALKRLQALERKQRDLEERLSGKDPS